MRTAKTLINWADVQADLSLRWAHRPFGWFCYEAAHFKNPVSSQDQDQDQDSLLVKRRNDNHSPGPVISP